MPIKAYQGSPNLIQPEPDYPLGRYKDEFIGSGEGAQAYGHGHYFAENPEVANTYKYVNSSIDPDEATYGGKPISHHYNEAMAAKDAADRKRVSGPAMSRLNAEAGFWEKLMTNWHPDNAISEANTEDFGWPEYTKFANSLDRSKFNVPKAGHMYEVAINAHPDHFLDWDKPLSDQPQHIQDFAKSITVPNDTKRSYVVMKNWQQGIDMGHPVTGSTLHTVMSDYGTDLAAQRALSKKMQDAGIPGIKYLDQSSRGKGEGTRNYVVFDPSNVDIKNRYAKGGITKAEGGEVDNQPENDLLQPIGKSKTAGAEKPLFDDGIYKAAVAETPWSNRKSIRYIHHDDEGNPIGAMQIMTHGPKTKTATIQNVYVAEKYRRQKIASGLLARARQDFDVRHSKDLTLQGKNFAKAVKNTGGYVHKAEGGPIAAPVGGFPGMKAMPKLANAGPVAQSVPMVIPRMQEVGSGTGYGPNTPVIHPAPLTHNYPKPSSGERQGTSQPPNLSNLSNGLGAAGSGPYGSGWGDANGYGSRIADISGGTLGLSPTYNDLYYGRNGLEPMGSNAYGNSGNAISDMASNFGNNISDKFSNLGNNISDTVSNATNIPKHFSLGNAGQVAASLGGMTPLSIPIMLGNAILTGTNTIPEASSTGNPLLDKVATQGGATHWIAENVVNPVSRLFGGSYMDSATGYPPSFAGPNPDGTSTSSSATSPGRFFSPDTAAIANRSYEDSGVGGIGGSGAWNGSGGGGGWGGFGDSATRLGGGGGGGDIEGFRPVSKQGSARGGRTQACKEARKAIMIARAMGGRIGKDGGGGIDEEAPVPAPVTSGPKTVFTNGGKQYEFAVTPPEKQITTKDLAAQTTAALQHHLSLPYMQQVANSKAAANKLAPYVGRDKKGAVKPFLTMNAKLEKASAGYEAGPRYDAQAPLQLPGGIGVETIGMPLSPAYEHNKFKVCPNSAVCKDDCLGVTSGNYAQADWWPRQNSKNRTHAFMSEPGALAVQLHNEIQNAKHAAAMRGNKLAVRLNVLSDIDPRVHETLIKANPDVDFYDYTKMNYDPIAPNHHYTYSSTGLSQPGGGNSSVNGLTEGVENKHQNWKQMRNRLDTGSNVAMVFSHKEHLPREVYDRETDKTYRVVDGTTHDYRPLDKQDEGSDGVIIGLQNLNKTGKQDNAYKDSNGFVVHYDPQVQMVPNKKTGLPTKTAVKGPSPGVKKDGKSLPRPTFPTNYRVEIAPQGGEGRADGGAVNHGQQKIHPDYAAQQFHNYQMFYKPESAPLAKGERPTQYAYGGPVEGDRQLDQSGFYNAAAEAAKAIPQAKGTPQQMMSMVQKAPGTQETMKWSGADQAFAGQPIVSKDDLVKHFQTNAPKLEETQLGLPRTKEHHDAVLSYRNAIKQDAPEEEQDRLSAIANSFTDSKPARWERHNGKSLVLPGGENYREVLMRLPYKEHPIKTQLRTVNKKADSIESDLIHADLTDTPVDPDRRASMEKELASLRNERLRLNQLFNSAVPLNYTSSHWEEPNVVAHLRMSDRKLPQTGEKALHLEELQSDWGQDVKKNGAYDPEKPYEVFDPSDGKAISTHATMEEAREKALSTNHLDYSHGASHRTLAGPYVGSTAKWTELGLKRALIEAARGGHDKLIWTPGEDQADRYDLSQQVRQILVENHGGEFYVKAYDHDDRKVINERVDTPEEMARLIGKEATNKAMEHMESSRNAGSHIPRADLRGIDLKVGGEGMKGYYDKIVPTALARIVKSIGHTPEFGTDYIQGKKDDRDLVIINRRGQYHVETPDMHNEEEHWQDGEHVAGPFATREEADAHRTGLYKGLKAVPSLKITPAMRETISKGLPRKTGGFVPPARSSAVEQALKLTSKSGATLPAAVFLARQHQRRD